MTDAPTVLGINSKATVEGGEGILIDFATNTGPVKLAFAHENIALFLLEFLQAAGFATRERGDTTVDPSKPIRPFAVTDIIGGTTSDNDLWFSLTIADTRIDFLVARSLKSKLGTNLVDILGNLVNHVQALPEKRPN